MMTTAARDLEVMRWIECRRRDRFLCPIVLDYEFYRAVLDYFGVGRAEEFRFRGRLVLAVPASELPFGEEIRGGA